MTMDNINIEKLFRIRTMNECIKEGKKIREELESQLNYNEQYDILLIMGGL